MTTEKTDLPVQTESKQEVSNQDISKQTEASSVKETVTHHVEEKKTTIMIESRPVSATLKHGNDEYPLHFNLMPEVPSLTAASALSALRVVLKKILKPDAVSSISDEVLTMLEGTEKVSMKQVLKKVLPMLQASVLQKKLYGELLVVKGSAYVEETLSKELKGVSVHVAVLFEAIKEDPLVLAKIIPHMMGDKEEKKDAAPKNDTKKEQWL